MATKTVCKRLLQSKLFQTEQMVPPRVPNCTLLIIRITSLLSFGLGSIFLGVHHLFDDTQPHCNVFQYAHGLGGELDRCQQYHLYRLAYFLDDFFHPSSSILAPDQQKNLIAHIPQAIHQRFQLRQRFATVVAGAFARERRDRCDATQQLLQGIVGRVDQDGFAVKGGRDANLLAVLGVFPLFEFITPFGDAADPRNVVPIRQLDGMADFLVLKIDRAIGSLLSVNPSENEGVFGFHYGMSTSTMVKALYGLFFKG